MQIPILNGIYADSTPELRTAYPVNMVPVPKEVWHQQRILATR
jgi:hypothetical protein